MITATFRLCHCILSVCAISPSRQTESCVERDIPASEFSFEHHIGQTRQQSFSDLDKDHVLSINSRGEMALGTDFQTRTIKSAWEEHPQCFLIGSQEVRVYIPHPIPSDSKRRIGYLWSPCPIREFGMRIAPVSHINGLLLGNITKL